MKVDTNNINQYSRREKLLEHVHWLKVDTNNTNQYSRREKLLEHVHWLKVDTNNTNQYSRRENIEIVNVPVNILQKDLEMHIINMLKSIEVNVSSYYIVAVHRLGKRQHGFNRNVIVRFINRNHSISALKNKKQLSVINEFKKYRIQENLSPGNKAIYNKCFKLKKEGEINNLWTYNGVVHIKFSTDPDEPPMKIFHKDDIEFYMNYDASFEVNS